ncbi:hypothetical protein PHMEG_00022954 [Phytophthora megakarya]|uniref:Uncharacterized protein n=1 Tax=Phytophthora megakarya TaxID=4795 RepID=A0A225VI68_9STRA|nr:hypothetical protein PHMEG_00022954 [Phytophthora megakarya]
MSMNHPIPMGWPVEVYDYEKKTITDEAVGGIDLRKGSWIHCKWCNSTLKTTSFSLVAWQSHQRRRTHLVHEQRGGSQPVIDHELLMVVRRDLHKNKQRQSRYERDVRHVINAMTNLVSDQQSDLRSLQHKVQNMVRQMGTLKKEVEILRRNERQQKSKAIQKEVGITSQWNPVGHLKAKSGLSNGGRYNISQKPRNNNKIRKRNSMSDMDLFEKRFQLK